MGTAQFIRPATEQEWHSLRLRCVTSTESAALFGISPYATAFEIWQSKRNATPVAFEANERTEAGLALQDAIAHFAAKRNGWTIEPAPEFALDEADYIGASFDYRIVAPFKALLECKNVDALAFRNGWQESEFGLEAPGHIETQVQHQLEADQRQECAYIAALVGGNRLIVMQRDRYTDVGRSIRERCRAFRDSVLAGKAPDPDYARDLPIIAKMYGYAEPGKVLAQPPERVLELCAEYSAAGADEKNAKERKDAAKAELLTLIGDAERVLVPGYNFSAGVVYRDGYTVEPCTYRNVRISAKKGSAK